MHGARLERDVLPGGAVMTTVHGGRSGPTLALLGGVHGDEDEGVLAVWRILDELEGSALRGTVRAVAPANPAAWSAGARRTPHDGGDLARSFPGDCHGGPTEVIADGITNRVIDGADLLIDLHSGGLRYSMPLFCGVLHEGLWAAAAFGAPLTWLHDSWPHGRSLVAARDRGIPAMYVECGGGGAIRQEDLRTYVTGVLSVMAELGMLSDRSRTEPSAEPRWVRGSGDLDAGATSSRAGLFAATAVAGDLIPDGGEIGRLFGYQGELLEIVRAPRCGVLMFLRRQARTMRGEVLFVLADPCEAP
ncbi:succinylglutamate desuccinylase/aspartoacylase family protein [Kribbella jejuensis]|uniref:succinylglutamate desuccinylase/aspartoacylase family protein n=1 Tax=Kribbella jejuensis TaxID=236068 RepID=UPI001EE1A5AF|nr:M14 family metallopeptidase [Kribbella jejuensis]